MGSFKLDVSTVFAQPGNIMSRLVMSKVNNVLVNKMKSCILQSGRGLPSRIISEIVMSYEFGIEL